MAIWATEGIKSSGASGTLLADTGPIGGQSSFTFLISSVAALAVIVAHRNAANTADVSTHLVPAQVGLTMPFMIPIDVVPDGRVIVRSNATIVGSIQATILRE